MNSSPRSQSPTRYSSATLSTPAKTWPTANSRSGRLLRWLQDLSDPVVRVGRAAVLDVDKLLAQPHGDGAGSTAADEKIAARRTHLADRRDDGRRAAGERLFQLAAGGIGAPLVDRVGLLAHARARILRQRDDRIAGDAGQDGAERRRRERTVVEHEEDVHAAEFLDVAALDRIEENDLIAAVTDGLGLRAPARGGNSAAFDGAGAADRGARVVLRHPDRHGRRPALEIGADRRGDDGEDVFRRRLHAEEDLARDHEGPQVETALAAWYPGAVDAHELLDRFDEHGLGQRRHGHALSRIVEATGIGVGTEQGHAAVVARVGLEAFENLLRVVQDGWGRIEREIRAGFDARAMPALRLIVADQSHVIGENPAEAGVHEPCRALLLRSRTSRRLDFEFQTHSLAFRCRNRRDFRRRPVAPGVLARFRPDDAIDLVDRNCHGLSPGSARNPRPAPWLFRPWRC